MSDKARDIVDVWWARARYKSKTPMQDVLAEMIAQALTDAHYEWQGKFVGATTHPTTCPVLGTVPHCNCGAHARQAELHAAIAKERRTS